MTQKFENNNNENKNDNIKVVLKKLNDVDNFYQFEIEFDNPYFSEE